MSRFLEILFNLAPGELAGADQWRPRLVGVPQSPWMILGLLAVLGLLVWVSLRSYLREGLVPRPAKLALAALRITVVLLVLTVLLQPALRLKKVRNDYGTVVVLIDDTLSMSLIDRYADPVRRAELAAKLPDGAELDRTSRTDLVRALLSAEGGPVAELARDHALVLARFGAAEGAYVQPLASLPRAEADDAPAPATAPSPAHVVVPLILAGVTGAWMLWLLARVLWATLIRRRVDPSRTLRGPSPFALVSGALATGVFAVAVAYAWRAEQLRRTLPETVQSPARQTEQDVRGRLAGAVEQLRADGFQTNLTRAVREAVDQVRGRRLSAVVLISDGQSTLAGGEQDRLEGARQFMRERNIPLLAVAVGNEEPARNIRVDSLAIPPAVRRGGLTPVEVALLWSGYPGEAVEVLLERRKPGQDSWESAGVAETLVLESGADADAARMHKTVARMNLFVEADAPLGEYLYRARVAVRDDEILPHDNEAMAPVSVGDQKIRVLLVSGDAGWEFQFLRNYLLSQPHKYDLAVWQQNAAADFNQESSSPGMQLASLPRSARELMDGFDVVILYDPYYSVAQPDQPEAAGFDGALVKLLNDFVSVHRGGLCYIASNKYTSDNLVYGVGGADGSNVFEPLAKMLPVSLHRQGLNIAEQIGRDERVAWRVLLSGVGADHPVMQLGENPDHTRGLWNLLPGVYWSHPVIRLKPAAVALAHSSDTAAYTDDNQPLPLVAVHMYGRGPVLYLGFDGTWRWRYVDDAAHYRKFWSNAMEFLASYRLMKKRVLLSAAGDRFAVGAEVPLRAEVYDEQFEPSRDESFLVRVIHEQTQQQQELTLLPDGRQRGGFRGTLTPTQVGSYRILAAGEDVKPDDVAGKTIQVTLPQEEFERPQADPAALAGLSGQRDFIPAERFEMLAQRVPPGRLQLLAERTVDLWNVWLTVVLLAVLLAAEWIARKRYNMA